MLKRTKIVATLGPATDGDAMIKKMIDAGLDVVRANFSHGSADEINERIKRVRRIAAECGKEIAVLADLQGPKIRISSFKNNKVHLDRGQTFIIDANMPPNEGDETCVGIDYLSLYKEVKPEDILILADGAIQMRIEKIKGKKVHCTVLVGGELSNHKGINLRGGGLSAGALTKKDKKDIQSAADANVDFLAVSFPRNANDIHEARKLFQKAGSASGIIAKIERTEAVENIDDIVKAADGIMVARGDLAVEIGDAEVPWVQKLIIDRARALNKPVITATQMMESMIYSPIPTRAEVSDVANAVLDGTDAVMLSAETAVGEHPDIVIEAVARACLSAEKQPRATISGHRIECHFTRADEAIAMAAMYTANHLDIKAIISLTESGATPLWMSRIRSGIPVYGLSRSEQTRRKMSLYRGVYPINFDLTDMDRSEIKPKALDALKQQGAIQKGDLVILTKGDNLGELGGTNVMKILDVE